MERAQYLQAMRDQSPEEFRRLSQSGELERQATLKVRQASLLFKEITKDVPRDEHGNLPLNVEREAQERVNAEVLEFPPETREDEDQVNAVAGARPRRWTE